MKQFETLAQIYRNSVVEFGDLKMSMYSDGAPGYTFAEFGKVCEQTSDLLSAYGIGNQDKVALLSGSCINWAVAFFSSVAHNRVIVPILPDFSENEVTNVLTHSESKVLFVSDRLLSKVSEDCRKALKLIIDITTLKPIYIDGKPLEEGAVLPGAGASALESPLQEPQADDLAALIYTSGTTGKAKGVMLTQRNITHNVLEAYYFYPIGTKDVMLSILPLAHTYELSLGLIYPFATGACVAYMTKKPTPSALKEALPVVRPTAMLTVPMIIEKVYKGVVVPKVKKSKTLSFVNKHFHTLFCRMAGKEILRYFGGRLKFFGIGGAKLDVDVEKFLKKARFPYYIGYGLTECAPLLSGCSYKNTVPGGIGKPFYGVQMRLDNVNPETGEGEIVAIGPNIMPGYYKDPERTADAFTEDGWFRTNDLASVDRKGRFSIKGRLNNMILGPSGENIYPEEIEKVIKDQEGVAEAIVIERNKKLIALIELADGFVADVENFKKKLLSTVNSKVAGSSKIGEAQIMKEPFIKTATQKIRRFLYKDSAPTIEESQKKDADSKN